MPATAPALDALLTRQAADLGARIRAARKQQGVPASTAAQAAGMSRSTWHRIEAGEVSVTLGAFLSALAAVGLKPQLQAVVAARELPSSIRLGDYPGLRALAWQLGDDVVLSLAQLRELLERQGRHLDEGSLRPDEQALIARLRQPGV